MNQPTLSHLIALGEGFTTEFKRSMPSDLGREICAFANATGGVILIGVDDAGTVTGVRNHNRLKSRVQSVALSADPPVAVEVESQGSVQVYIFQDRVEIVTPGGLPAGMREEDLGSRSVPRNPLLFNMLYRMKLVEQIGSGVRRIHDACLEHGVAEPVIQVSTDWVIVTFPRREVSVAPHVRRLVAALQGEMSRVELMAALGLADRSHFLRTYLHPSLDAGLIEMTLPQSPRSRHQRYRLTALGGEARRSRQESEEEGITARTRQP